jgi:hypothetical protein
MFRTFVRVFFSFGWGLSLIVYDWSAASATGALDLGPFLMLTVLNMIWALPGAAMMKAFLRPHREELESLRRRLQSPGRGLVVRVSALRAQGIESTLAPAMKEVMDELESVFAFSGLKCSIVLGLGSAAVYSAIAYALIPGLTGLHVRRSWLTVVSALVLPAIASSAAAWLLAKRFAQGRLASA